MINVIVAIIENTLWVELKPVPGNSNGNRAIIKLINKSATVAFLDVFKGGNLETSAIFFANSSNSRRRRSVGIVVICLNAFDLNVGIGALQKPTIASISQTVWWTVNDLLGWQRHYKAIFIDGINWGHGVGCGEGVASTTDTLITDFSGMDGPINGSWAEISSRWRWGCGRCRSHQGCIIC